MKDNNMREILFRGKRVSGNKEWIFGNVNYYPNLNRWFIRLQPAMSVLQTLEDEVAANTVGQYTGLTDKNGKKIFDGDIVKYKEENGEIVYHDQEAMFVVCFDTWFTDFDHLYGKDVEIVGNIHDNPELLEGGVQE